MKSIRHPVLIDQIAPFLRKPSAAPLLTPAEVISAALSLFVPGPARLISPTGIGVKMILLALDKTGYKIVPAEREDHDA